MKVENLNIQDAVEDIHISEFGVFYFFKNFVIAEIHQGVIYNWDNAQDVIKAIDEHYGDNAKICYISNRINKYSINPTDWIKFYNSHSNNKLNGYAIVSYSKIGRINALIEKLFIKANFERFSNLYDAIEWSKNVNLKSLQVEVSPL